MNGSILIFGANENSKNIKIKEIVANLGIKKPEKNSDILYVEQIENKKSIGIDQIRNAIKWLGQRPFSEKNKVLIFKKAQIITGEGQNALLKILEETPSYATIILCTKTEEDLIPTVLSRCQKINLKNDGAVDGAEQNSTKKIIEMTMGERLSWAEEESKDGKDEVLKLLENWVFEERKNMLNNLNFETANYKRQNIEEILQIIKDLETTNVNLRLALEVLITKLK